MRAQQEALRQRIRYLVEEGGVYPGEPPATKPLLIRLVSLLVVLELVDVAIALYR